MQRADSAKQVAKKYFEGGEHVQFQMELDGVRPVAPLCAQDMCLRTTIMNITGGYFMLP